MEHILISGFADEISPDFDEQLRVVTSLGMEYRRERHRRLYSRRG